MQGVVDANLRFLSYSLRSGSQNDKGIFNMSKFGKTCHLSIPRGGCFLADAGYKLYQHIITPYSITLNMPDDEAHFNLLHSRTRITVERAFALWKNTFRIFKADLTHEDAYTMAEIIEATLVLHNWFIDYKPADYALDIPNEYEEWMHIGGDIQDDEVRNLVEGDRAIICRDIIKNFLYQYIAA